jgi:hypothetical protein
MILFLKESPEGHSVRMPLVAGVLLLLVGLWSAVVGWRGFAV